MTCLACKSITGQKRISPGPIICEGKYWIVDHAYPTGLLGWLVIVLKQHKEALHELTQNEYIELSILQEKLIAQLHLELNCEKEYVACFAEGEGFKHIHFHIIPKTIEVKKELKGPRVFEMLKHEQENLIPDEKIIKLSETFRDALSSK